MQKDNIEQYVLRFPKARKKEIATALGISISSVHTYFQLLKLIPEALEDRFSTSKKLMMARLPHDQQRLALKYSHQNLADFRESCITIQAANQTPENNRNTARQTIQHLKESVEQKEEKIVQLTSEIEETHNKIDTCTEYLHTI